MIDEEKTRSLSGPVVLCTRCECTRKFPKMLLEGQVHIHMVTGKSARVDSVDGKRVTHTEIRTFVRTDKVVDGYRVYVEKMP